MKEGDSITCRHYMNCRHYCEVTDSCDYILNTGRRRPVKPEACPGYPEPAGRRSCGILLPGSYIFDPASGQVRGRING